MKKLIVLAGVLLMAACSQLQQMSAYHVTEADIEQLLRQQLPRLARQAEVAGIPLQMSVKTMQVDIGPDNSNKIRLKTDAVAALSLFGLSYPANMQLQLEAVPFYDGTQKAVYLRSVKLLNSSIEAAGYRGNLSAVTQELMSVVNGYLASNPVYRLDQTDPTIKMLTAVPVNMAVQQGRLSFMPGKG